MYNIMLKPRCSPGLSSNNKNYTCYTDKSLEKLKNIWNMKHPDNKIKEKTSQAIWKALKKRFSNVCESERCWLRQTFIKNKIGGDILDIIHVMKHIEQSHKTFVFIGPSPIDFDKKLIENECVWDELCKFNLSSLLKKGKTKIGMIFNTDPHMKDGEHWISMFIDITGSKTTDPYIFFFDSNGDKIVPEVKVLVKRIKEQGEKLGIHFKFYENHPKIHQKTETECGMYSLYMIIELLNKRKTYKYFMDTRVPDKDVEILRKIYFN